MWLMDMRYCELFALVLCIRFTLILTQECITPIGIRSVCRLLNDCAPLLSYMERRPDELRTPYEKHYIKKLKCSTDNMDREYFCCARADRFFRLYVEAIPTPEVTLRRGFDNDLDFPDPSKFECGIDLIKNRITGGHETELGEYPWMALLEYENRTTKIRSFGCGGSLIHRRYVLTAAHCILGSYLEYINPPVNVRLGEHNITATIDCQTIDNKTDCADSVINVGIEYARAHPRYKTTNTRMDNDIGIIRLARDIETTKYIEPICFPPSDIDSSDGMMLTVSGWGNTRQKEASDVKLRVEVPIINYTRCQKLVSVAIDNDNQICAGAEYAKDACHGDSGGPLMKLNDGLWYLEGVVSFGIGRDCGEYNMPGIYTRVNAYRDWVLDYIQYMNKW